MDEQVQSARETFRKLAVFEINPKVLLADYSDQVDTRLLLESADIVDQIFWRQALPNNNYGALLEQIGADDELREMLFFYHGPYDRFNNDVPFLPSQPELVGAGFYPRDLTREEFASYIRKHRDLKPALESPYTVITRANSHLRAVPYHVAYNELVNQLCDLLGRTSQTARHAGFSRFLKQRANDLATDDYFSSETLWVTLEGNPIDFVIGPYEVYQDQLMGLKAAYQAILFERDFEESDRISHFQQDLASLCKLLEPGLGRSLNVEHTNAKLSVGNLIYAGGEARNAVPAIAFSLPNDERVIEEVGSRQVLLRNVLAAKFKLVAQKIAGRIFLEPLEDESIAFDNFFNHTIFHEISHSIGPQRITVGGEETTVNRSLRQYHSVLEEAKADALGVCLTLTALRDLDLLLFFKSYIAHLIRATRFGLGDAHGSASAIQFNYLLQESALNVDGETGKLSINQSNARDVVFKLTSEIISIQELGDFDEARRFVKKFSMISPPIKALFPAIQEVPVDIRIRYFDWKK